MITESYPLTHFHIPIVHLALQLHCKCKAGHTLKSSSLPTPCNSREENKFDYLDSSPRRQYHVPFHLTVAQPDRQPSSSCWALTIVTRPPLHRYSSCLGPDR